MREPRNADTGEMVYLFTWCEYGGGEIASCRVTCDRPFADAFERGLNKRIDADAHYVVREEIGEDDVIGRLAELEPWVAAA
jgi:hypothetical protein